MPGDSDETPINDQVSRSEVVEDKVEYEGAVHIEGVSSLNTKGQEQQPDKVFGELKKAILKAEATLRPWIFTSSDVKSVWCSPDKNTFLAALDKTHFVREALISQDISGHPLPMANELIKFGRLKLTEELKFLLRKHSVPMTSEELKEASDKLQKDGASTLDASFSDEFEKDIPLIAEISHKMVHLNYTEDVMAILSEVRGEFLVNSAKIHNHKGFSVNELAIAPWEGVQLEIDSWMNLVLILVKKLFTSEKKLVQSLLHSHNVAEKAFAEITKESVEAIFGISPLIKAVKLTPEKIFKVLEIYEELSKLRGHFESLFSGDICEKIRARLCGLLETLGEAVISIFLEFEHAVEKDVSEIRDPIGGIHGLPNYVLNYLICMYFHKYSLALIFVPHKSGNEEISKSDSPHSVMDFSDDENLTESPFATLVRWILDNLCRNLERKASEHKKPTEAHFFLMTNFHYIAKKVKDSEIREIVGDLWIRKRAELVRRHGNEFQKATWGEFLQLIDEHRIGEPHKKVLKEKFLQCNQILEGIHSTQKKWLVYDNRLKEELKSAITERVLGTYLAFFSKFARILEAGRHPTKYIKYSPDNVREMIQDLFKVKSVK